MNYSREPERDFAMSKYGQYCPVAQALDILGERWTLLIIRDMLTGTRHFSHLRRGLPGLSTALLAKRLRQLQRAGIVEKRVTASGRATTEYDLTHAGKALQPIITALLVWGVDWAFGDPSPEQLDPLLLLWWMHDRIDTARLPPHRVSIQFNFRGAKNESYWLVLTRDEVTVCLTDPGYPVDVLVESDLATSFKVWLGRLEYSKALVEGSLSVSGIPRLTRDFPRWFMWSPAAATVRAARPLAPPER